MKKIGFLTFTLLGAIAIFSLQSCNNDDEDPANYFTHGENTYSLKSGLIDIDNSPTAEGVYEHDIILFSPEIQIILDSGIIGNGDGLVICFECSSAEKIEAGTYNFNEKDESPFLINCGAVLLNLNFMDEDADEFGFDSGSVTVKENNGDYEFTWNFEDEDGKKVTGNYKGRLIKDDDVFPK